MLAIFAIIVGLYIAYCITNEDAFLLAAILVSVVFVPLFFQIF